MANPSEVDNFGKNLLDIRAQLTRNLADLEQKPLLEAQALAQKQVLEQQKLLDETRRAADLKRLAKVVHEHYQEKAIQTLLQLGIHTKLGTLLSKLWTQGQVIRRSYGITLEHQNPAWLGIYRSHEYERTIEIGGERTRDARITETQYYHTGQYLPATEIHMIAVGLLFPDYPEMLNLPQSVNDKVRGKKYLLICDSFSTTLPNRKIPEFKKTASPRLNKKIAPYYSYFCTITPEEYPDKFDYFLQRDSIERFERQFLPLQRPYYWAKFELDQKIPEVQRIYNGI